MENIRFYFYHFCKISVILFENIGTSPPFDKTMKPGLGAFLQLG